MCLSLRVLEKFSICINLQLMDHLNSLPAFSEVLEPRVLTTHMVENPPGEWRLTSAHRPMERVPFVIQPGTKGVFNEQNPSSIVWKCRFNFFYAVHHEMLLLLPQVCAYIFICLLKKGPLKFSGNCFFHNFMFDARYFLPLYLSCHYLIDLYII